MNPELFRRVEAVFDGACELPEAERAAYLDGACGDDAALRAEVDSLLAHLPGAGAALGRIVEANAGVAASERRIGAYRVIGELGRGGMGAVYLAERDDEAYATRVAIKLLHHGFETAAAVARFRDERQILATLAHPGIVRLLDGGSVDAVPYLVMEHVEGAPIHDWADARKLAVTARVALLRRVLDAVAYAHQKLVVHRDIKPGNILVTADGTPKLLDFGIAKLLDPAARTGREAHTRTGMHLLTPEYASPEQIRGEAVSVASDIYSLGVVLYELLTGRTPLRFAGGLAGLRALLDAEPPRASTVAPAERRRAIAGDLDTILARALSKDPARRYASAEQLSEDLGRHLAGLPVLARPATWLYRAGKFVRRHRSVLALLAVLVVSAALFAGYTLRARAAAVREAELARTLGEDVKEMQLFMRYAYSLPLHDVERERSLVRARLVTLAGTLDGASSPGPVHAALGHGYLALHEPEQALPHLQAAADTLASPDLEYALGRALVDLYRVESDKLARVLDPDARAAARAALAATYRDPALVHLRAATLARLVHPDLLAGLIALVEERHADALRLAQQAEAAAPWFSEATMLVAEAHWAVGRQYKHDAAFDHERLMRSALPALESYRRAAAVGRSDPRIHTWACELFTQLIYAEWAHGGETLPRFRAGREICEQATAADPQAKAPRSAAAWLHLANISTLGADARADSGEFTEGIARIDALRDAYPDDAFVHWMVGESGLVRYLAQLRTAEDAAPSLARAVAGYRRSLALDPGFDWSARQLFEVRVIAAREQEARGEDPFPELAQVLADFSASARHWASTPGAVYALGKFHALRAELRLRHGQDPTADLREGERICREGMAMPYWSGPTLLSVIGLRAVETELAIATGGDTVAIHDRVAALLREPPEDIPQAWLASLHLILARLAASRDETPEPHLERGLAALSEARARGESVPRVPTSELLSERVRWAMQRGQPVDAAILDEIVAGHRDAFDPAKLDVPLRCSLAAALRLRAAWQQASGADPTSDLDEGLALVAEVLARAPDRAQALAIQGALRLIAARVADTPDTRRELARRAAASLSAALRGDPYLTREYQQFLAEATRLAGG